MITEPFRVAAVQAAPVFLDREATVAKGCALIAAAAEQGARVIAFPETWVSGYPVWLDAAPGAALWDHPPAKAAYRRLVASAISVPSPEVDRLGAAAKAANAYVVVGAHELGGGTIYCSLLYFGPDGSLLGIHRKLMPTYQERLIWGQGDGGGLLVFDTPLGQLGGLCCWEHWMPLTRQALHQQGETIHIAAWPHVGDLHQLASRSYAFEGRSFVIAAGTILRKRDLPDDLELLRAIPGEPDDFLQRGGSAIIGPDSAYLAGPVWEEEAIVVAEIDPARIVDERLTFDAAGHYNRPDVFEFRVRR
jgi:predicted amidohydrolase